MDKLRRTRARDQNRPDDDIRIDQFFVDRLEGCVARANAAGEQLVEQAQARKRSIEDHDVGAKSGCHSRRVSPHDAAADHRDPGRRNTRHASDQLAHAVGGFSQGSPSGLNRQPPRHLAHWREQRKPAIGVRHRFIGNRGAA